MKSCSFNESDLQGLRYYHEKATKLDIDDVRVILNAELKNDNKYNNSWEKSKTRFEPSLHRVMEDECHLAVMAYTTDYFFGKFNDACLEARDTPESWEKFKYKSFFYLLIRAFSLLPPFSSDTLYRAQRDFKVNEPVAFPKFLSTSQEEKHARRFAETQNNKNKETKKIILRLLRIPDNCARDISEFSPRPWLKEVLIWPFCTYKCVSESSDKTGMITRTLVFECAVISPDMELTPHTSYELYSLPTTCNVKEGRKRSHSEERTPSPSFHGNAKKICLPGAPFPQPADLKPEASSTDDLQPTLTNEPS